ncbi:MAG: hypothetical protein IJ223_05230 [Clostridia bacterium]|nr:hypothetical protein [Clostridia bacterium]
MKRVFCFGNSIVKVSEDGNIERIELNKFKFLKIVLNEMKKSPTVFKTPDEIVKQALVIYAGGNCVVPKCVKRKGITDSSLYMKLRRLVVKNRKYIEIYSEMKDKSMEKIKALKTIADENRKERFNLRMSSMRKSNSCFAMYRKK